VVQIRSATNETASAQFFAICSPNWVLLTGRAEQAETEPYAIRRRADRRRSTWKWQAHHGHRNPNTTPPAGAGL